MIYMSKRTDKEIIADLQDVECALSPENLSCDGEASVSYVRQKSKELMAKRKALVAELGREPTDAEVYSV